MAPGVTVTVMGLEELNRWMNNLTKGLGKTENGLLKAVNRVGAYWQKNFETEGGYVGGWAELAERTIQNRADQGFGAGPILFRYGGLWATSTKDFATTKNLSFQRSRTAPYDERGITATSRLSIKGNSAVMQIEGPQVFNQWPGRRIPRPAREFWFIDGPVTLEAGRGVAEWVEDVIKES